MKYKVRFRPITDTPTNTGNDVEVPVDQLDRIVDELTSKGRVAFSFSVDEAGKSFLIASVRECLEHDFTEYGEEYEPGLLFEISPAKSAAGAVVTQLIFPDVSAAANAVLKRRAERLGEPWQTES